MAYVALYRSYRPKNFSEVIGQQHVIRTLKNAVIDNKTSHAYIFSGLRGIGKTTIARILAKAVNCESLSDGEPCNCCKNCLSIINDETTDIIELDAASNNGVDEIRSILEKVNFLPSFLRKKVYIIDEAHMLSTAAFNALLKTLEEPPLYVMFILATTEPHKIPQTILSRCQRFDFKQLTISELSEEINTVCDKEHIEIDEDAVYAIAEVAEGGMRDALGILDLASVFANSTITAEDVYKVTGRISQITLINLVKSLYNKDAVSTLQIVNELSQSGKDTMKIVTGTIEVCRDLLLYKNNACELKSKSIYSNDEFQALSESIKEQELFYYVDVLVDISNKIKYTNSPKIYLEVGLLKIINSSDFDIDVLERVRKLEDLKQEQNVVGGNGVSLDFEAKFNSIDNKIKKVFSELDKADLQNFKEKIESKMDVIEDIASKGSTIDNNIIFKFDELESKINFLDIEFKTYNFDKINQLDEKISNIANSNVDSNIKEQLDFLNNEIDQLKNQTISGNESSDFSFRLSSIEASVSDIYNKINLADNNESNSVNNDIISDVEQLIENYSNLTYTVKELLDKSDSNQFNQVNSEGLNALNGKYVFLVEQLETLKGNIYDIQNEIKELNDEESSNVLNELNNKYIGLNDKYIELNNEIKTLKDEISNTSTTKVSGINLKKSNENYIPMKEEPKVQVVEKKSEPKVEQKPEPIKKIVELNENKTVKTVKNVYDIRMIERIMNESWSLACREEKARLTHLWPKLEEKVGYVLAQVAQVLRDGKLVANGKNEILIVYPSATICNHLMEPKNYNDAKQVMRITFGKDYEFMALPDKTWQEKRSEYIGQHSIGIKYPKLSPLNNPELKVEIPNYDESEQNKNRPLQQAKNFFGVDLVKEEKE